MGDAKIILPSSVIILSAISYFHTLKKKIIYIQLQQHSTMPYLYTILFIWIFYVASRVGDTYDYLGLWKRGGEEVFHFLSSILICDIWYLVQANQFGGLCEF